MCAKIKHTNKALGKVQTIDDFLPSLAEQACRDESGRATLTLLKILAIGNEDVAAGRLKPASEVIARLRAEHDTWLIRRTTQ